VVISFRNFSLSLNQRNEDDNSLSFLDNELASDWAKEDINAAYEAGLIQGYPDQTVAAQRAGTLAESIMLLRKMLQSTGLTN
jgi:hypothetical protein